MKKVKTNKIKSPRKFFGYHMIMDCYGCNRKAIDSVEICYKYLDKMVEIMKVHRQSLPFVVYTDPVKYPEKAGISGWIPIVESGVSIHTITPTGFASIDVYSCKKYSVEKIRNFTKRVFKPKEIEEKFFLRGEKYVHPAKAESIKKLRMLKKNFKYENK